MADAKKDEAKKYSMIPGMPAFIVGIVAVAIGYYQMYPEHFDGFLKKFERSGAVAMPTSRSEKSDVPAEVVRAPEDEGQLFFDNGAKEVRCDVPIGSWSAEIVTPEEHRDYSWDVKPDNTMFYVRWADGHIEQIGGGAKRFKDVGRRRGVMRFYGTTPGQKVVVKLE